MKLCVVRFTVGLTLFAFGLAFYWIYHPLVFQYLVEHHLASMVPSSIYSSLFVRDTTMHSEYYIFELTNGRAFLQGQRPTFREHGPYVFRVTRTRYNVTWFQDEHLVSYYERSIFHFDREKSVTGLEDVRITVINLPFLAIMDKLLTTLDNSSVLRLASPVINAMAKRAMAFFDETLLERRTPYDILSGRPVEMFERMRSVLEPFAGFSEQIVDGLRQLPKKIGFIYDRNDTTTGPIVLYTGLRSFCEMWLAFGEDYGTQHFLVRSIDQLAGIQRSRAPMSRARTRAPLSYHSFEGKFSNEIYPSPVCDRIEGHEGSLFDNLAVRRQQTLSIYTPTCKMFDLVHAKRIYFGPNIPIEQYTLDPYAFSTLKHNNWCYCKHCRGECIPRTRHRMTEARPTIQSTNRTRLPRGRYRHRALRRCDGFHDLQECQGAPLALTFPHFMYSHNLISSMGGGVNPSASKHQSYFNIDPLTGFSLGAFVKLQTNMRLERIRSLSGYENVGADIVPFIWLSEGAAPSDEEQKQVTQMLTIFYGFQYLGLGFALVGFILMLCDIIRSINSIQRSRERERRKSSYLETETNMFYNNSSTNLQADQRYGRTPKASKVMVVNRISMPPVG